MTLPPSYVAVQVDERGAATVPNSLGSSFNNGEYSISAWVQYDGLSSNADIIKLDGVFAFRTLDNGFSFQLDGRPPLQWTSETDLGDDWIHTCITYSNGSARLFVNGVFKQLVAMGSTTATSQSPVTMGSGLQGLLRNITIYNQALSPGQVLSSLYNNLDTSLILGDFDFSQNPPKDLGPKGLAITLAAGANSVRVTPCLRFQAGGFAYPMHDQDINPGGHSVDPYTVQAWIYLRENTPQHVIFANSDLDSDTGMRLSIVQTDGKYQLQSKRGSDQSGTFVRSSTYIEMNRWTNVATTFDGSTLTVFIDGVSVGSTACPPIMLTRNAGDTVIGATFSETVSGGIDTIRGCISDLSVWNIALSGTQLTQYMTDHPDAGTDGLVGNFTLSSAPARNRVNGHPVSLAGSVKIFQHVTRAATSAVDQSPARTASDYTATPEMLERWRAEIDFEAHKVFSMDAIEAAEKSDLEEFESDEDRDTISSAYDDVRRRLNLGDHPEMPLLFTRHEENGRRYLIGHDGLGSYVAYEDSAAAIDDCTLWKIQLVFVVIAGALDALVGVRASLTPGSRVIIRNILRNPRMTALLANGGKITAAGIFSLMSLMAVSGHFKSLLWAIVDLGLWSFIRVAGKLLLDFLGVGAADIIASLAATVVTFITTYAQKPASCDPIPKVTLGAVSFNHDPTHSTVDALSIRKNATQEVKLPEWQHGDTDPTASPAAYAIGSVTGKTIKIQASFTIDQKTPTSLQIQATGGGIMGAIPATTVNFVNGQSSPKMVTFDVPNHQFASGGIRAENISWAWQFMPTGGSWTRLATSQHRIYALMQTPVMPWKQSARPAETQLPWTEALDYACQWATEKTTMVDVVTAVSSKIYSGCDLKYDTTSGASKYTNPSQQHQQFLFELTQFLKLLKGQPGNGKIVNCTDCATIVTTFSNILGTDVRASVMRGSLLDQAPIAFKCNKIQAIGYPTWEYPFPPGNQFAYHEVAWTGNGGSRDNIFDACLKFDSSDDPWDWNSSSGHTPVLPANFQFTSQTLPTPLPIRTPFSDQTYRERLAQNTATGIQACMSVGQFPHTQSGRRMVR